MASAMCLVTYTSGAGDVAVQIDRFDSNVFAFVSGLNVVGTALIQYDGADGNATAVGCHRDWAGSASRAATRMPACCWPRGAIRPVPRPRLRVYTNATNFSTTTINIPDQACHRRALRPLFGICGGRRSWCRHSRRVGAIELLINGVAELDATVTVLRQPRPNEVHFEPGKPECRRSRSSSSPTARTPTRRSGPILAVGATATFTYTVRSTGGTSLQNVVVTDDNGTPGNTGDDFSPTFASGDTNSNNILETTETWTYTATRTVTAGQYTNIGSVTAQDSLATQVTDSDPSNHFGVNTLDQSRQVDQWPGCQHGHRVPRCRSVPPRPSPTLSPTRATSALASVTVARRQRHGRQHGRRLRRHASRAAIRTATADSTRPKPGPTRQRAP